ncbi:F0F1 ATP synthase subunit A [Pseudonocardia sp. KRD-184]|uniref:ATP synthase subunit a n=1 Tax=Pseudonocardia oceani TaxID=2792013 RepID=A0ABS6U5Y1_9PSEU|nr:F0F1 ATP synthase subunit A [Pseudonocardia oceani]MBW0088054.1 F0F1 ATP synthase subunit A [Pseudonocardia oceani]MBW0098519.1 F0F1 ATP synthase subunit A [Pseudonocardia oceani]MBW0108270.1 F0F1 ATP synthase subunit A [Pseudonocardia oceani]MBW0122471.1 F0F1 ATP synthase subunit A [Pseudonocardia oceani]MBW0127626.1 F0F1 ATP synthase subunit A [Pseudonocardia oceani]
MGEFVLAAEEFTPPGVGTFIYPPIFGEVTKPIVQVVLAAVIVIAYFTFATRKLTLVPSRSQFAAETIYGLARNTMARDQIGGAEFKPFIPLVLGLFSFVLVNNLFGIIPVIQFPSMSRIGFPIALALFVYVTYHYAGFRKHGFVGYIKHAALPPGVPIFVAPLIVVIELFTKFIFQPLSLALRVFAAMFAGHLILVLAVVGGEFLLFSGSALVVAAPFAFVAAIAFTFLEVLVMSIQAYVFALLAAVYIGAAVSTEH